MVFIKWHYHNLKNPVRSLQFLSIQIFEIQFFYKIHELKSNTKKNSFINSLSYINIVDDMNGKKLFCSRLYTKRLYHFVVYLSVCFLFHCFLNFYGMVGICKWRSFLKKYCSGNKMWRWQFHLHLALYSLCV